MDIKLLALAGIMTATFGLTACDTAQENASDDLADAQEEVQDAQEELNEAAAEGDVVAGAEEAVVDAEADIAEAQAATEDSDMMVDDVAVVDPVDPVAVDAADEVVVVEE